MKTKSYKMLVLVGVSGTLLQFGGCFNLDRISNGVIDHVFFALVINPLLTAFGV